MKKILIVDDEQKILEIFIRLLVSDGYIVRFANNAQSAVNIIIREEIDVILLDLRMPEIDGRILFDVIKEYNPLSRIIISSAYALEDQKLLLPDAVDYFDKSTGPNNLLEKVKVALAS